MAKIVPGQLVCDVEACGVAVVVDFLLGPKITIGEGGARSVQHTVISLNPTAIPEGWEFIGDFAKCPTHAKNDLAIASDSRTPDWGK